MSRFASHPLHNIIIEHERQNIQWQKKPARVIRSEYPLRRVSSRKKLYHVFHTTVTNGKATLAENDKYEVSLGPSSTLSSCYFQRYRVIERPKER